MTYQLNVKKRQSKKANAVRAAGEIPAVVYGPEFPAQPVSITRKAFLDIFDNTGESTLINCSVEGHQDPVAVLIQDVQRDPVRGDIVHVDLRQVNMAQEIDADIPLEFTGEAPAVKTLGGVLVKNMESIAVRCLPGALVSEINVALEPLATFDEVIAVKDIAVPEGLQVLSHADDVVAKVVPPRSEEELASLSEKPVEDVAAISVAGGKPEEEAETKEDASKE